MGRIVGDGAGRRRWGGSTAFEALGFTFEHGREPLSYCLVRVILDDGAVGWG